MSFNAEQFRSLIERVLEDCEPVFGKGFASTSAVELLMLTAAQESHLGTYLRQVNGGPAKGVFQIEVATEYDTWQNYLDYFEDRAEKVETYTTAHLNNDLDLEGNIPYQIIMARLKYWRDPYPLPESDDIHGLAKTYKRVFNTYKGKATVEEAMENYRKYCR